MNKNWKAIGAGCLVFVVGYFGYLLVINFVDSLDAYAKYSLYLIGIIGGAITGKLSKQRPLLNSSLAGALMGILVGVINYIYWSLGFPADFGGIGGLKIVVAFSIPLFVLLALVGGAFGSNEKNNETLNEQG